MSERVMRLDELVALPGPIKPMALHSVIDDLPGKVAIPRGMDPRNESWIMYSPALVKTLLNEMAALRTPDLSTMREALVEAEEALALVEREMDEDEEGGSCSHTHVRGALARLRSVRGGGK